MLLNKNDMVLIKSNINQKHYPVHNLPDKQKACDMLAHIHEKLLKTTKYISRQNDIKFHKYTHDLDIKFKNTIIQENEKLHPEKHLTSYNQDKGYKIVFCMRDINTFKIYDENIIMYVALHELSHIACPEIGHPPLFVDIFTYVLKCAMAIGSWKHQNYALNPQPYCGITINEHLV